MKKSIVGLLVVLAMVMVSQVFAESEAINPSVVKTRRIVAYGNAPVCVGSTELTEANIIALKAGGTLPAVNGAAITSLSAANITAGGTISAINGNSITNMNAANLRAGTSVSAINGNAITNINAANVSGTYGAGSGANLTSLPSAQLTDNIAIARLTNAIPFICLAAGTCTNGQVVAYAAVATSIASVQLTPTVSLDAADTWSATSVNTTNFTCTSTASGTNFYYAVFGIK